GARAGAQPPVPPVQVSQFGPRPYAASPTPPQPPAPIPLPSRGTHDSGSPSAAAAAAGSMAARAMSPKRAPVAPAMDTTAPRPSSSRPDLSGLSPRVRELLERELKREDASPMPLRSWLITASVIATLGIALILMQRFGVIDWPALRGAAGHRMAQ